jgi:prepilin-type N-terminal cleavage/methylation domain-containing protein
MNFTKQRGFSLLETMAALAVLLGVGGIVMSGMVQLMKTQSTIANRTEMHTSVRSATELMQQEIGQAGKVSLGPPTVNVTMAAVATGSQSITFTPAASVYPGEALTVDTGANQETVTVTGTSQSPSATFTKAHASATTPVTVLGAFATGVVPPDFASVAGGCAPANVNGVAYPGVLHGSTCTILKLYGDINGDGNMVYVEYTCTQGTSAAPGFLYRNQIPYTQLVKPATDNTMILLANVLANPNDANGNAVPCFNYQVQQLGTGYCVTNVAVTLTVQTQNKDQQTGQYQPETKALLNVGPRNIVEVYGTANLTDPTRAQGMPTSVATLTVGPN